MYFQMKFTFKVTDFKFFYILIFSDPFGSQPTIHIRIRQKGSDPYGYGSTTMDRPYVGFTLFLIQILIQVFAAKFFLM